MSFQPNGGPSYCTARRYSASSLGKGSFRSRLKGSLAQSFLGSLSSRWSLNNKEGFEDFIHNDNGIRLDPLVRKRKSLKDGLRQSSENVPRRNRSFSESWGRYPVNSGKKFLSRQNSPLRVDRSSSPGRWFNHQNTPPWQASPSLQRQSDRQMRRRHRSDLSYQQRHRSSDGDILLGSKFAKQNIARNHRHSEGDILISSEIIKRKITRKHRNSEGDLLYKNIESAKEPADLSLRTRKRCTSEGDVEGANELSMNDPKSNTKFESDSNLLKDNEKEYVEAIISSLKRNSITQKFREDILQRNGFYNSFRSDSMLENNRTTRHRNSYCGSFDSLDSIDSWSSCNSIENLDINSHDTPNNEQSGQRRDIKEFPRIVEDNTGSACPDIIAAHKADATLLNGNEEDVQETEETSSWMDSSYWNLELLRKEVRPRSLPMSRRSSRRHRLKGIRARSLNDKDRWIRNNSHSGYMNSGDGNSNVGDSLANLKEEVEREINRDVDETASLAESDDNTCNALQACREECASYFENSNEDTATGFAEFVSLQKDEIKFCSGKHGNLDSGEDDVDLVFDAITKEANKLENSEKDLMVVFFVGKLIIKGSLS